MHLTSAFVPQFWQTIFIFPTDFREIFYRFFVTDLTTSSLAGGLVSQCSKWFIIDSVLAISIPTIHWLDFESFNELNAFDGIDSLKFSRRAGEILAGNKPNGTHTAPCDFQGESRGYFARDWTSILTPCSAPAKWSRNVERNIT